MYPGLVQFTSGNRTTSKTTVMVCVLRTENIFCFSPLCPFPRMRGLAGGRARGRGEFGGQVPREGRDAGFGGCISGPIQCINVSHPPRDVANRVRGIASVYRFIGVWQQDSGK